MKRSKHPTLYPSATGWVPKNSVYKMTKMDVSTEQMLALDNICLGIFADMSNAGSPIVEILKACYLSGVNHTLDVVRSKNG